MDMNQFSRKKNCHSNADNMFESICWHIQFKNETSTFHNENKFRRVQSVNQTVPNLSKSTKKEEKQKKYPNI